MVVEKTIVIIDFAHSGTTMLSGILEILGVPMVTGDYEASKWEDRDLIDALVTEIDEERAIRLIDERNKNKIWGFKLPGAWIVHDFLKKHLTNPVYVAIYKDPVSVTRRRFGGRKERQVRLVRTTIQEMHNSIDGIYNMKEPVRIFSYQNFILHPKKHILDLIEYTGIEATEEQIDKATAYVQPNKTLKRIPYPSVKKHLS